jgi:hypothetical protein
VVDGHNAGVQGLHILIVLEDIILTRVSFQSISRRVNLRLEEEE